MAYNSQLIADPGSTGIPYQELVGFGGLRDREVAFFVNELVTRINLECISAFAAVGTAPAQATQAALEAQTNEDTYAPPDLIKHSPGVAKVWAQISSAGALETGDYNVESHTDTGVGDGIVVLTTNFSGTVYSPHVMIDSGSTTIVTGVHLKDVNAGSFGYTIIDEAAGVVDKGRYVVAFGDQ